MRAFSPSVSSVLRAEWIWSSTAGSLVRTTPPLFARVSFLMLISFFCYRITLQALPTSSIVHLRTEGKFCRFQLPLVRSPGASEIFVKRTLFENGVSTNVKLAKADFANGCDFRQLWVVVARPEQRVYSRAMQRPPGIPKLAEHDMNRPGSSSV